VVASYVLQRRDEEYIRLMLEFYYYIIIFLSSPLRDKKVKI
jgi:hypothetical protein